MVVQSNHAFLSGDSVMAGLMRGHDWSTSPLGEPATWPQPLRSVVNLLLGSAFTTGKPFVGRALPVTLSQGVGAVTQTRFVDFTYQPLRGAEGQIEGIFVQGYDITEQHQAREALHEADRQKDEFLATLAHELRNPLAPIRTAAHLLVSPAADDQARARATGIITRQVAQMSRLLDDLIDISRITQRRLSLKQQTLQVGDVVEAALEVGRPLAEAKRHTITTDVADPNQAFVADAVRITQVLSNLLNNACKFTDPGGHIHLSVSSAPGRLAFTVSDDGAGLSASVIATCS